MLVYDITNPKSFDQLDSWREEFLHQVGGWAGGRAGVDWTGRGGEGGRGGGREPPFVFSFAFAWHQLLPGELGRGGWVGSREEERGLWGVVTVGDIR